MAVTRRQAALSGQAPTPRNDAINRMRRGRRWVKRYRPNDHARRHRISDSQPKTQHVVSYTRRG